MKIIVSGLINIETTLKVRKFPIEYYPIDYPFFGINSDVSGVAYNVAKAFLALGNKVQLTSFIGEDEEGRIDGSDPSAGGSTGTSGQNAN